MKTIDQIVKIVAAGSGVIVDASMTTDQLVKIAAVAAKSGALVVVKGADSKLNDQLVKIAVVGHSRVIFDLTQE